MPDTIAAIATPQLPSAIGILRLSGPDTRRILDVVFSPAHGGDRKSTRLNSSH